MESPRLQLAVRTKTWRLLVSQSSLDCAVPEGHVSEMVAAAEIVSKKHVKGAAIGVLHVARRTKKLQACVCGLSHVQHHKVFFLKSISPSPFSLSLSLSSRRCRVLKTPSSRREGSWAVRSGDLPSF